MSCGLRDCAEVAGVKDCLAGVGFDVDLEVPILFTEVDAGTLVVDVFIAGVFGVCGGLTTF